MTQYLDQHKYNVAIAELMKFSNGLKDFQSDLMGTPVYHQCLETLCTLLAPMAPHVTSELWGTLNEAGKKLHLEKKPKVRCVRGAPIFLEPLCTGVYL